jgi:ABC-type glycerol-3-phosphate transport system substrate-binding protein
MWKKVNTIFVIGLICLAVIVSGCAKTANTVPAADDNSSTETNTNSDNGGSGSGGVKQEITVWSFTDEAKYAIQKFEEKYPDIKVNFVYIPSSQYETKLRSALQTGAKAPDAFSLENGFVRKFIDNPALADLAPYNASELITQQYPYVQATEKDSNGNIKVIGYQGTPGGIHYRRDLAKTYLGTDDPDKVSEMISSWDKIFAIGEKVAADSGGKVHALANWNAIATVQNGNVESPWVVDGKLVIDQAHLDVLDLGKQAQDTNVVAKFEESSPAINASMQNGEVMFYPGATWYLQYVLKANAPKTSGLWGLAHGPGSFSAGGTFYGIYNKSKKQDLAWQFINFYSFDHDFLKQLGKDQIYFTSNKEVNNELAPDIKVDFLGGQKYFEFFGIEGDKVPSVTRSKYDGDIDTIFNKVVQLYMKGDIKSTDEVIARFKKDVKHDFAELVVD